MGFRVIAILVKIHHPTDVVKTQSGNPFAIVLHREDLSMQTPGVHRMNRAPRQDAKPQSKLPRSGLRSRY